MGRPDDDATGPSSEQPERSELEALRAELAAERSARALAEQAARRAHHVLDALPHLVAYVDADHRYAFLNAAHEGWFGVRRDDFVGRPMSDLLGAGPFELARPRIDAALAGERRSFTESVPDLQGLRHVEGAFLPDVDPEGRVLGVVTTAHDISARVAARDELERLADALRRESAALADSERRFRSVQEATPDGFLVLGPVRDAGGEVVDFGVVYVNPVTEQLFGRPQGELVGLRMRELAPSLASAPFWAAYLGVAATGVPETIEGRAPPDGRTYRATVVRLGGEIGVSYTDVSARRKAEESLRFLAEASRVLSDSLELDDTLTNLARLAVPTLADWAAIDMIEGDGLRRIAVVHVDPARVALALEHDRLFPARLDAPYGIGKVIRSGEPELTSSITEAMLEGAGLEPDQLALLRQLGLCGSMIVPLQAEGRVVGALSLLAAESGRVFDERDLWVAEDLARRAGAAVQNAMLYRAAQEASRSRDEFLATISHELRTPLTAILGWARLLVTARSPTPTQTSRGLAVIERNARAQAQLIEDLLDVSRVISGKLHLARVAVDVNGVVEAALESAMPAAESRGIEVETALDRELPPLVGDPDRLQQVVWNLVSNAVKFTGAGGRVRVDTRTHEGHIEVRVADTGRGMKPEFLPFVFERFRQADSRTTREYGGLGLGLAIVRHLVELHGGSVHAESEGEGHGSTFVVLLPRRAVAARDAGRREPAVRAVRESDPDAPQPLVGQRVLVVDDEADARELVSVLLEAAGATTRLASSAADALAAIDDFQPTVVVSDLAMPGGDGFSLVGRLRERGVQVPAIALTAYARREDRARALEAGFQLHVAKPIDPAELVQAVFDLLEAPSGTAASGEA